MVSRPSRADETLHQTPEDLVVSSPQQRCVVSREVAKNLGQGMGSALTSYTLDGLGVEAMQYGQTATSEQLTFLGDEPTTQRKRATIPIYRVSLVRESRLH